MISQYQIYDRGKQNIRQIHSQYILYFLIFKMISKNIIERVMLFPQFDNQGRKSISIACPDLQLPSQYLFRSSQQIQSEIPITHPITQQPSKQNTHSPRIHTKWPQICIGLILGEHCQNNQTFYVYGTGTLIHKNIVLTNAQNLYCRRLQTQYKKIRFITGVSENKCNGIYDVKRSYFPNQYLMQEYKNYDYAILQLFDDLSKSCGYVGWKTSIKPANKKLTAYSYMSNTIKEHGSFNLSQLIKSQKIELNEGGYSGSVVLMEQKNQYYLVGLYNKFQKNGYSVLTKKMRNMVNECTSIKRVNLCLKNLIQKCQQIHQVDVKQIQLNKTDLGVQGCKQLSRIDWKHLTTVNLHQKVYGEQGYIPFMNIHKIGSEGCKYISEASWQHLTTINLKNNNILEQGCKYLNKANWIYLNQIELSHNDIGKQGCKYLCQANWTHLRQISLLKNNIRAQGCKYLSQANWTQLQQIELGNNDIGPQGCKYLSQTDFKNLIKISLINNKIGAHGCKYLSQANWTRHLIQIILYNNFVSAQGCKYLSQANWTHLTNIILNYNMISDQGCKYLSQSSWSYFTVIDLYENQIENAINKIILNQVWPNAKLLYQVNEICNKPLFGS